MRHAATSAVLHREPPRGPAEVLHVRLARHIDAAFQPPHREHRATVREQLEAALVAGGERRVASLHPARPRGGVPLHTSHHEVPHLPTGSDAGRAVARLRQDVERLPVLRVRLRRVVPRRQHGAHQADRRRHLRVTILGRGAVFSGRGQWSAFSFLLLGPFCIVH